MRQLIAEVDNASRPRDRVKGFRSYPSKRGHRFANDNELTFDGGSDETVLLVFPKTKVQRCSLDRIAGCRGLRTTRI